MVTATKQGVAVEGTTTEPVFDRARHLVFAVLALAHGPLLPLIGVGVGALPIASDPAIVVVIEAMVQLCFAAFVAWLAFVVFDTHAGITVWPRRWRDLGSEVPVLAIVTWAVMVWAVSRDPAASWQAIDGWVAVFSTDEGQLRIGWMALLLAYPIAEELVYRALLLRALEGYIGSTWACLAQAAVFQLVHAFVYGYGFTTGAWFIYGLLLGLAFQRSRSLAAPVLIHTVHNVLFFAAAWCFNH